MRQFPIFTPNEVTHFEAIYKQEHQCSDVEMVEIAASCLCESILEHHLLTREDVILFLVGPGFNGLDALVLAFQLNTLGYSTDIYLPLGKSLSHLLPEPILNFLSEHQVPNLELSKYSVVIDGVFGHQLRGELPQNIESQLNEINQSNLKVISIDFPSGLSATTGIASKDTLQADFTLACDVYKPGHFLQDAKDYCGTLYLVPMGFITGHVSKKQVVFLSEDDSKLPKRLENTHKYHHGNVLVIGGSEGFLGAPVLSSHAALRSGAGLVSMAIPNTLMNHHTNLVPDVMKWGIHNEADLDTLCEKKDAFLFGPGLGKNPNLSEKSLLRILTKHKPTVIDADGLILLKPLLDQGIDTSHVIITPHAKEFCQLFDVSMEDVKTRLLEVLSSIQSFHGVLLLKGPTTLVKYQDNIYFFPIGHAGMAKAGFGDVLAGIILSMIAKYPLWEGFVKALALFHFKGLEAKLEFGEHAMMASDLMDKMKNL